MNHFFVVGAQRSGTTYLYHLLHSHPEIFMARPVRPEPKYFLSRDTEIADYRARYFSAANEEQLCGEKSTTYIESPSAARAIASAVPNAKIVFLLRDPIERAISNYWLSVRHGFETKSIDEALRPSSQDRDYDRSSVSTSPYHYLRRGLYADRIEVYRELFGDQNIHLMIFEDFVSDRCSVRGLFQFLNVDPTPLSTVSDELRNSGIAGSDDLSAIRRSELSDYFRESTQKLVDDHRLSLESWASFR